MTTLNLLEGKEQIIEECIPLVKYIASRISLGKKQKYGIRRFSWVWNDWINRCNF